MNALADLFSEAPRPQPGTSQPIQNDDGSVTTERSITVTDDRLNGGHPTNIPTVWNGRVVSDDEAIDNAARSGMRWPSFASIPDAVSAAEQRSQDLGAGTAGSVGGATVPPEVQNALPYRNRPVRGEPIFEQGGGSSMSALQDLFPKGGSGKLHGMTIIVVPGQGQGAGEETDIGDAIGTPFNFRDGIAPDGRGSDDIPLDHPSDCSSFIANLIAHLTGDKVRLPDLTDSQVPETEPVEHGDEQPGDLLFSKYDNQGPIDWGHVAMLLKKHGDTPDQWSSLEQSDAPGPNIGGRPGVDIRQADHAIDQGGSMIVRRVPGLR